MLRISTATLVALTLPLALSAQTQSMAATGNGKTTTFTITVENISTGVTLQLSNGKTAPAPTAPVLFAVHRQTNPFFTTGSRDRGQGLENLAEQGNPAVLAQALDGKTGIVSVGLVNVPTGETAAGPLTPGKSYRLTITAEPGQRLSLAMMFAQSNDLFFGTDDGGIALFDATGKPLTGDLTSRLALWDAGTEVNQEPGLGPDQAPRQATPTSGTVENGVVRLVHDQFHYPTAGQVIRVTIAASPSGMSSGM